MSMCASTPITAPDPVAVEVAVGCLRNPTGEVLVTQRRPDVHQAGYWEFPGGKCAPGETVRQALDRELQEELGIEVRAATPILRIAHAYPGRHVVLQVFRVESWRGTPRPCEGQPMRWAAPPDLAVDAFPAANRAIVHAMRLPPLYLISPDPEQGERMADCVQQVVRRLQRGDIRLLQIRAPRLPISAYGAYAHALLPVASALGVETLLNVDPVWFEQEQARLPPRTGLHLPERRLYAARARPTCSGWVAASVHDARSLARAVALGVDFVTISPVYPTASHPGAPPLGLAALQSLCAESALPVYALGGLHAADVADVQAMGAQGVAGIRGLLEAAGNGSLRSEHLSQLKDG